MPARGQRRRTAARIAVALLCAGGATGGLAESASAWRLFSVIGEDELDGFVGSVAALPDGALLFSRSDEVYKREVSGHVFRFAGNDSASALGDGGRADEADLGPVYAVSAAPGGAVLIAARDLIRRVGPDGTISTVAGSVEQNEYGYIGGVGGYSGDGGPATAARLCGPHDVAALPDGGFLIADTGNSVIRQVAPDGTITTVAGIHDPAGTPTRCGDVVPSGPSSGDGGPATAARLSSPSAVAPLRDGGFLILDYGNSHEPPPPHLRHVDGAGTITGVPGITEPGSVVGMPDGGYAVSAKGGVLLAARDGSLTPIGGGGRRPSKLFGLDHDGVSRAGFFNGEGRDARTIAFDGQLVVDPLGGLIVSEGYSVSLLAEPPSGRMGIAIRRVKAPTRAPQLVYVATAPGTLAMSVRVGRRRVGPIHRADIEAGMGILPVPRVKPGAYQLTVRAIAANGTRDSDRLGIVLGGRLPISAAAQVIANFECDCTGDAPDTTEYLGRCRRFSRTRVDCRINARELDSCEYVGSALVRPGGFVWTQTYGCPMRKNPRGASKLSAAPLL